MQAILKEWKLLIFGGVALVFLAYVADPLGEFAFKTFRRTNQSSIQVNPQWQRYTNLECGFVVTFPSKPFRHPQALKNNQNVVSYRQFAAVLGSNQAFMVATLVTSLTTKFSDEQKQLILDKICNESVGENDKLLATRSITLGTITGREIELVKADGFFYEMRHYPVEHGLQTLTVRMPQANQGSTNISYFLDSFRLLEK